MNTEGLIKQGIGVVGVILAAFGGFLTNIAPPPDAKAAFPVGIASVILLFVFLLIRFTVHYNWTQSTRVKLWTSIAVLSFVVFLVGTFIYYRSLRDSTFTHLDGKTVFVKSNELTEKARARRDELSKELNVLPVAVPDARLVAAAGDPRKNPTVLEQIWTKESLEQTRLHLTLLYVLVVVSIGLAILALTAL